jgi:hypothetical protein
MRALPFSLSIVRLGLTNTPPNSALHRTSTSTLLLFDSHVFGGGSKPLSWDVGRPLVTA